MQKQAILILGANGQVGSNLTDIKWPPFIEIHAKSHQDLDIKDTHALESLLKSKPWAFVINASGYVQVDKAETAGLEPYLVNGLSLLHLATICCQQDIPLLHYTTDYVFDGTKDKPYIETDSPNPINAYGMSKLFGEMAIKDTWHKYIILRSSWVYGLYGRNFVKTILSLAKDKKEITVVSDQYGIPTWAEDLALATRAIILEQIQQPENNKWGTYHYIGEGITSWYEYAQYIVDTAFTNAPKLLIKPSTTTDYRVHNPGVTNRPLYTALNSQRIQDIFGIRVRPWQEGINFVLKQLSV